MGQCQTVPHLSTFEHSIQPVVAFDAFLGRYKKIKVCGEGQSCICHKCTDTKTNEIVAVKVYKKRSGAILESHLLRFERQIEVLQALLGTDFRQPNDSRLWHHFLEETSPQNLFVPMKDYSKTSGSRPGIDPAEGSLYVVMECAQYSLKAAISQQRERRTPFAKEDVRCMSRDLLRAVAGLHAKGFVHMDLKPDNIMMCNDKLKLIDVDGCKRNGDRLQRDDQTLQFSPVYCSPELAHFLTDEDKEPLTVSAPLDVWSVGVTLGEMVTLSPVFGHKHDEALSQTRFFKWLWTLSVSQAPLPRTVERFDAHFHELVQQLLCGDKERRRSCCEALGAEWFEPGS